MSFVNLFIIENTLYLIWGIQKD